jgi:glycosyltransferase involved in cell wall biosynthesis
MQSLIRTIGARLRLDVDRPAGSVASGQEAGPAAASALSAAELLAVAAQAGEARDHVALANKLIDAADRARDTRAWETAAELYAQGLEADPERAGIWVQYGHALKESGRLKDAEAAYRRSLALKPEIADTHLQLGHALKLAGRMQAAARAYVAAVELAPESADALIEIDHLLRQGVDLPADLVNAALGGFPDDLYEAAGQNASTDAALAAASAALESLVQARRLKGTASTALKTALKHIQSNLVERETVQAAPGRPPVLVFDVADLFAYFRDARLPTGIQRVQIEVISGLLRAPSRDVDVRVCCFDEMEDTWVEIPARLFLYICGLCLSGGDLKAPDWVGAIARLGLYLRRSPRFEFPQGAYLINLGTSWWLQNYFLNVRRVKRDAGVRYVPFVHDLIPILTPEHCIRELTLDFISWTLGVFQHADLFLTNSTATERDLLEVAARLGHDPDPARMHVVRLDADFRRAEATGERSDILRRQGLEPGGFVLFVSTIESRKNHVGAFNAWLSLVRKHGADQIPRLVCVGAHGWLNDVVHDMLASSPELDAQVTLLSRLSDEDLACLYRNCLFTLYPSHYEGWGLPVTEALSWGKAALISDASSLPEAGGVFADYFRAGSDSELAAAAEKLIFDHGHRAARERLIQAEFRPRPWSEIGRQIYAIAAQDAREAQDAQAPLAACEAEAVERPRPPADIKARLGVYYPIRRNEELRIWPGLVSGEMFRSGAGWWWPDDWGVWTRAAGGDLTIATDGPHKPLRAFIQIRGLIAEACRYRLDFASPAGLPPLSGKLGPEERSWLIVDLPHAATGLTIQASLTSDTTQDLSKQGDGLDRRITGVGLLGLFLCEADDLLTRLLFAEAAALNNLTPLTPGFDARPR